jgi:predicted transport protein
MAAAIDPQMQTMIDNMPEKTGKSLQEWYQVLTASKLEKHGDMMKLLKGEYGVTHGFANTIALLYRQQAAGGAPEAEDLVAAQYAGGKAQLKPLYDTILAAAMECGPDVEIAAKKTYVSLRRSKQFAIVQASTKTRIDLGLNLKGVEPTDRLEGGNVFSGMCTHRVQLTDPGDVDGEVKAWIRQAYEQA